MKLKDGFMTHDSDGEQIMVAVGDAANRFHGLVRSNQTAALIIDCLKQETSKEQITDRILEEFEAPRDVVAKDVQMVIDRLKGIGAIDE